MAVPDRRARWPQRTARRNATRLVRAALQPRAFWSRERSANTRRPSHRIGATAARAHGAECAALEAGGAAPPSQRGTELRRNRRCGESERWICWHAAGPRTTGLSKGVRRTLWRRMTKTPPRVGSTIVCRRSIRPPVPWGTRVADWRAFASDVPILPGLDDDGAG